MYFLALHLFSKAINAQSKTTNGFHEKSIDLKMS